MLRFSQKFPVAKQQIGIDIENTSIATLKKVEKHKKNDIICNSNSKNLPLNIFPNLYQRKFPLS